MTAELYHLSEAISQTAMKIKNSKSSLSDEKHVSPFFMIFTFFYSWNIDLLFSQLVLVDVLMANEKVFYLTIYLTRITIGWSTAFSQRVCKGRGDTLKEKSPLDVGPVHHTTYRMGCGDTF